MKNKCTKCDKELGTYDWGLCYNCKTKEEVFMFKIVVSIIALAIFAIFGVKLFWAKYAYNDYRCVFSECRLLKD